VCINNQWVYQNYSYVVSQNVTLSIPFTVEGDLIIVPNNSLTTNNTFDVKGSLVVSPSSSIIISNQGSSVGNLVISSEGTLYVTVSDNSSSSLLTVHNCTKLNGTLVISNPNPLKSGWYSIIDLQNSSCNVGQFDDINVTSVKDCSAVVADQVTQNGKLYILLSVNSSPCPPGLLQQILYPVVGAVAFVSIVVAFILLAKKKIKEASLISEIRGTPTRSSSQMFTSDNTSKLYAFKS